jgi:hypothetical protein
MAKTIRFIKKDGEIMHRQNVLNGLENAFNTIANGAYILTVKKEANKRSLDQNSLVWLWFTCIERETGTDKNDIHDYYCSKFLHREVNIHGKRMVIGGTSKLNTAQFADFLNKVQADAASEFGIRLPSPDDLRFEEFKNEYSQYLY